MVDFIKSDFKDLFRIILIFYANILGKLLILSDNNSFLYTFYILLMIFTSLNIFYYYFSNSTFFLRYFFIIILLICSSLYGDQVNYGLNKVFLGICIPLLSFLILAHGRPDLPKICIGFILAVIFIDIFTFLFKFKFGFFDRNVKYGLLGPITFGWLNGIALFSSLILRKNYKIALIIIFSLFIFWSGSKGPILAYIVIFLIYTMFKIGLKTFIINIILITSLIFLGVKFFPENRLFQAISLIIENPDLYIKTIGRGSIGERLNYWKYSIKVISTFPLFGVGFGNWSRGLTYLHLYPHNLFFELLSELGFLLVINLGLLIGKLNFSHTLSFSVLFGFICMMFSGDFSYIRYILLPFLIISSYEDILLILPKENTSRHE